MWKCHKCGKPVYFAERKQSLGYNWHPECLRCEECGKRLNPGQHAEHKGVPYCHVPCYGALFGPQLFGHGTRVESHKSFGQQKDTTGLNMPRSHLEAKLKAYNQYFEGKSGEVRCREVNGRLILEGSLRIYWGVQGVIHLKEDDDQRTVVTVRKRNSCRISRHVDPDSDEDEPISNCSTLSDSSKSDSGLESSPIASLPKSVTLPSKLDLKTIEWDELDDLLQVERKFDENDKMYRTMPVPLPSQSNNTETLSQTTDDAELLSKSDSETINNDISPISYQEDEWFANSNHLNRSMSGPDCLGRVRSDHSPEFDSISIETTMSEALEDVVIRRPSKGSTAIVRRPGKRLSRSKVKRRCSINGHFYDRETSFFTPPHGSQTSVWVTSLVNTQEVINLMLEKYKVDSDANNFALFVVRDNGEQRKLKDEEYPLLTRVLLGPHEDVAKVFLMDGHNTQEVSSEVAQFLNLSLAECRAILNQYYTQEEREVAKLRDKYYHMKQVMLYRLDEVKHNL